MLELTVQLEVGELFFGCCRATAKVRSTTITRSWAARDIGAAPDSGIGPLYGDRSRLRLGWDVSLWGYGELETSSPAAASLGPWGLTWGCGPWALLGKPQEAVTAIGDPVGVTVKLTPTPAGQYFFAPHTPGPSHQILLEFIFLCYWFFFFFCDTLELLSQLYVVFSSGIILFSLLTSLPFLFHYRFHFFHLLLSQIHASMHIQDYWTWKTKIGSLTMYTCCW